MTVTKNDREPMEPQELLGMAAHELKNTLGPLGITLQLCERRLLTGEPIPPDDLAFARAQVRRLSQQVNDLLDTSRIDADQFAVRLSSVELGGLVQQALDTFKRGHNRRVVSELPLEPLTISADADRLASVLANFLDNAARYAPEPSAIDVMVKRAGDRVRIAVTDHGPGISAENQAHLFDRYFRVPETADSTRGLGLGLFLCRTIAERHGGAVGVQSAPGKGATFWLDLPLGQS